MCILEAWFAPTFAILKPAVCRDLHLQSICLQTLAWSSPTYTLKVGHKVMARGTRLNSGRPLSIIT